MLTLTDRDIKQYDCRHKWEYVGSGLSRCHKCEAQGVWRLASGAHEISTGGKRNH